MRVQIKGCPLHRVRYPRAEKVLGPRVRTLDRAKALRPRFSSTLNQWVAFLPQNEGVRGAQALVLGWA